ncbi:transcriptional regulatory protein [Bacillus sp. OxB-1]|nr:transcriptional regulatory protein [Bacillus sp. OxB-1]
MFLDEISLIRNGQRQTGEEKKVESDGLKVPPFELVPFIEKATSYIESSDWMYYQMGFTMGSELSYQPEKSDESFKEVTKAIFQIRYIEVKCLDRKQRTYLVTAESPVFSTTQAQNLFSGYLSGYFSTNLQEELLAKIVTSTEPGCLTWKVQVSQHPNESGSPLLHNPSYTSTDKQLMLENNQLKKVMDIHNRLTDELINTDNPQDILSIMREYVTLPIIIQNIYGTVTDYENCTKTQAEIFQKEFMGKYSEWVFREKQCIPCGSHYRLIAPIFLNQKVIGYCSFIYKDKPSQWQSKIEQMLIGRLGSICSLLYMNKKNIFDANERVKGQLFEKILANEFESDDQIARELKVMNIDWEGAYHIAFLSIEYIDMDKEEHLSIFADFYDEVFQFFIEKDFEVLMVQRANGILIFIPAARTHPSLKDGPQRFYERVEKFFSKIRCYIGVSSTTKDLNNVKEITEEALTSTQLATSKEPIIHFDELGILGIFVNSKDHHSIRTLARIELGPLYGETDQHKEWMTTLYMYLQHGGNLKKTAEDLMLSISGLRYRMSNIKDVLQDDLKNPMRQFHLLLALKSLKMVEDFQVC